MEITQQARIRRLQDTLIIAGNGVIAFVAWGLVKTALFIAFFDAGQMSQMLGDLGETQPSTVYIVAGVMLCIDLCIRVYVGLSARAEGRGSKKGPFYLVVAILAALVNALSAAVTVFGMSLTFSLFDLVASAFVELTAFCALAAVVCSSVRLRRLSKAAG